MSGDTAVVGARSEDGAAADTGSAYVFVKPGGPWANATETARLTASDGVPGDSFGNSVSVSGDTVVAGAIFDDVGGVFTGSSYVFVKPGGGWATANETAKLVASDGAAADQFGSSVSISGDTVVVGASGDNGGMGSAYVFVSRAAAGRASPSQRSSRRRTEHRATRSASPSPSAAVSPSSERPGTTSA